MTVQDIPLEYYTENGREIPGYSFIPEGDWDEHDWEAAVLASEWDKYTRDQHREERMRRLENEVADLRERLSQYE